MSAKCMGEVWELDLPKDKLLILLAYADHADHEYRNARPSIGLVSWKTTYSERYVRELLAILREDGIMVPEYETVDGVISYKLVFDHVKRKSPRIPKKGGRPRKTP